MQGLQAAPAGEWRLRRDPGLGSPSQLHHPFLPKGETPPQRHPGEHNPGQKQRCVPGGRREQRPLRAAQPLPELSHPRAVTEPGAGLVLRCPRPRAGARTPAPSASHPRRGQRPQVLPLRFATVSHTRILLFRFSWWQECDRDKGCYTQRLPLAWLASITARGAASVTP